MFLAVREIRRAKARFALLVVAIALLLFLILVQQALQDGLITRSSARSSGSRPRCSCIRSTVSARFRAA